MFFGTEHIILHQLYSPIECLIVRFCSYIKLTSLFGAFRLNIINLLDDNLFFVLCCEFGFDTSFVLRFGIWLLKRCGFDWAVTDFERVYRIALGRNRIDPHFQWFLGKNLKELLWSIKIVKNLHGDSIFVRFKSEAQETAEKLKLRVLIQNFFTNFHKTVPLIAHLNFEADKF